MKKLFLFLALMMVFVVSAAQAQQDNLKFVPADSDFIISINFKQLLSDPEVKKAIEENIAKSQKSQKDYEEFKAKTGIDIYKDLDSATIFTSGKTDPKNPEKQLAGAILNVRHDKAKIIANAQKDEKITKDVTVGKIEGFDAFIPKDDKDGAGIFIDSKSIAVGTPDGVTSVAKVAKGALKSITTRADFSPVLAKINNKATLTGAGVVPAELKESMKSNPNAEPFAAVKYFVFDFTKGDNLVFNLTGEVDKKEDVDKVAATLNAYLMMLRQFASQSPDAANIVNQIKVSSEGTSVKVAFSIKKSQIDEIRKKLENPSKDSAKPGKEGRE